MRSYGSAGGVKGCGGGLIGAHLWSPCASVMGEQPQRDDNNEWRDHGPHDAVRGRRLIVVVVVVIAEHTEWAPAALHCSQKPCTAKMLKAGFNPCHGEK